MVSCVVPAYGPGIETANRTLAEVEARERAGRVARIMHRLSGQASRDRQEAEAARANLADIHQRMTEQRGKLDRGREAERTAQEAPAPQAGPDPRAHAEGL